MQKLLDHNNCVKYIIFNFTGKNMNLNYNGYNTEEKNIQFT